MAKLDKIKMHDVVTCYDGSGDVIGWIEKLKLVAKLQGVNDLSDIIPLFLQGQAFSVYQHMSNDDKSNACKVEETLIEAFSINPISAYDLFKQREWEFGESVDGYLSELRRLAKLACIENDQILRCAFISGLPVEVSCQLRTSSEILKSSLPAIVQQARVLMSNRIHASGLVGVKSFQNSQERKQNKMKNSSKAIICYKCKGNHYIKECPQVECFKCHQKGHMANNCLNGDGKPFAPLVSQK